MLRDAARSIMHRVAPNWLARTRLRKSARLLSRQCDAAPSLTRLIEEVQQNPSFRLQQKTSEILRFLEMVREVKPVTICEIGAARGGSFCLFSRIASPDASLLSIDLKFSAPQQAVIPTLALPGQHVTCFSADSHQAQTLAFVQRWLAGLPLDVLFIDGDHTYAGVAKDFEMYAPLVRPGGIVGFHDIVPDFKTRFGTPTYSDVGEVPAYWQKLKETGFEVQELIDDPEQDGFGIGVMHWSAAQAAKM